jgi:predicted phage tail protein
MMFVEAPTKTPCLVTYAGAQAGMTVWYWMRWVNTRKQKGPWSDPVSATIAG